jgi:hypothetical protein
MQWAFEATSSKLNKLDLTTSGTVQSKVLNSACAVKNFNIFWPSLSH